MNMKKVMYTGVCALAVPGGWASQQMPALLYPEAPQAQQQQASISTGDSLLAAALVEQTKQMRIAMEQNARLAEQNAKLTEQNTKLTQALEQEHKRISALEKEIHKQTVQKGQPQTQNVKPKRYHG